MGRVVDVEVDPGSDVVVDVELDPGSNVVDVVVTEASANSRSSKWTMLFAGAVSTWKLAVKRTLWVVASISAVTLGSVCQLPSVEIGVTNEAPAPADAVPLDPVQSVPVYDCAVSATCTTSLAAVRYANRNV